MSQVLESSIPSDISLLLRANAEQWWLHCEVIPVLRQVETRERLPDEQVGAALAYLEAMWDEATARARETDAAHAHLTSCDSNGGTLSGAAGRYHTAVRVLREILSERVAPLVEPALELNVERSHAAREGLRVKDTRSDSRRPNAGGCTPWAA
jgi:hypothetical protein